MLRRYHGVQLIRIKKYQNAGAAHGGGVGVGTEGANADADKKPLTHMHPHTTGSAGSARTCKTAAIITSDKCKTSQSLHSRVLALRPRIFVNQAQGNTRGFTHRMLQCA